MSFLLTHPALAQLFGRRLPDYRIMAPRPNIGAASGRGAVNGNNGPNWLVR